MPIIQLEYRSKVVSSKKDFSDVLIRKEWDLTGDQTWGMMIMTFILFVGSESVSLWEVNKNTFRRRKIFLSYLYYLKEPYIVASSPRYCSSRPMSSWDEYIRSFHYYDRNARDLEGYYVYHLAGKAEAIVKFKTMEFLRGVLTVCKEFDLQMKDYVQDVFDRSHCPDLDLILPLKCFISSSKSEQDWEGEKSI